MRSAVLPILLVLLLSAFQASAQVYRWVDDKGRVHYSNETPPPGIKATIVSINAQPGPAAADSAECHTVRCQGERLEQRQARRDVLDARLAAERIALSPPPVRGLEFRKYVSSASASSELARPLRHPVDQLPKEPPMERKDKDKVEGEGSYTGSKDYNERTKQFIDSGKVEQAANDAKPKSEQEAHEMQKAERIGKQRAKK